MNNNKTRIKYVPYYAMSGSENGILIDDGSTAGMTSGFFQRYLVWELVNWRVLSTNNVSAWKACKMYNETECKQNINQIYDKMFFNF